MKNIFKASSLSVSLLTVYAQAYEQIDVKLNGVETSLYLQVVDWADAQVTNQSQVEMTYNSRAYLSYSPVKDLTQYFKPRLLGGYVEYDVDLSQ